MPRLSVFFIRSALLSLALGFTFGGLMLFNKGVPFGPIVWRLLPAHVELLLIGWTVQLVLGTAFWILPRFGRGPVRGNEATAWAAFGLLNLGLLAVAFGSLAQDPRLPVLIGRALEVAAGVAFAAHAWPRVKGLGK